MPQSSPIGFGLIVSVTLLGCGSSEPSRPVLPTRLQFTDQPAPVTTSRMPLGIVRVHVVTDDGELVSGGTAIVTLTLVSSDTGAHLAGTTTMQSAYGVATFTDLSVGRAGSDYRLIARVTGLDSAVSTTFQITAGPAAALRFDAATPPVVTAGANIPLLLRAFDAAGNPTTAEGTVTLALSPAGSIGATFAPDGLFGTTTATMVNGEATLADASIHKTGVYFLTASMGQLGAATSHPLTVSSGPMTQLAYLTPPPATASVNVAFSVAVVQLDQYGNGWSIPPGPDYSITLSLGANPTGAALRGTTTRTVNATAPVVFNDLVIDQPGNGYTLVATSGALSATSAPFNVQ